MDNDGSQILKNKTQNQDDSFLDNFKTEWKLFWHGIIGEDENPNESKPSQNPFSPDRMRLLTVEQIKQITRALSQDRKRLHQRIEEIQKEIDVLSENIESQELVGSNTNPTILQIQKLSDIGHQLSQQLENVNNQLDRFHDRELELKLELKD
jgi:hypothetical protein